MKTSLAYLAGADDRRRRCRLGLVLLHLAPVTDRELSDYWEGFHKERREDDAPAKRVNKRRVRK